MTTWKFVVTITASITLSLLDGCVVVASQEQLQPNIVFFMCALHHCGCATLHFLVGLVLG